MKRFISFLALCMMVLTLSAMPAKHRTFTHTQSDGTQLSLTLVGDENLHYYVNTATQEKMLLGENGDYYAVSATEMASMEKKADTRRQAISAARMKRLNANSGVKMTPNGLKRVGTTSGSMTGSKKGLVILVNFSDKTMSHTQTELDNQFNEEGYTTGGHLGSVHDYFYDQSYGQFDLTFDVVGPVTVSNKMSYYGGNDSSGNDKYPATMVIEALKLVDDDVNFADYDWDGDGEVDQVYVIYAGYGEAYGASSSTIWPHEWQLSSAKQYSDGSGAQTLDGVTIDTYACSCELSGTSGTTLNGIGTACHEFSHCLGFPDFYDTSYAGGFGMNGWDLMDAGSYNGPNSCGEVPAGYTSYERMCAGWLTPTELSEAKTVTGMKFIGDSPEAYVIYNDKNSDEYILLENRQNEKWFKYVGYTYTTPHGLLAIHVDYDETAWENDQPNNTASHQRMSIIPASGTYGTKTTSSGSTYYTCSEAQLKGHPFSGSSSYTSLTGTSNSSSGGKWFTACSTGSTTLNHEVTEIANADDGTISFLFDGGAAVDDGSRYTITYNKGTGTCATTTWTQTDFQEKATLPTATSPSTDWEFIGWSTTEYAEESATTPTVYAAGTEYQPTADVTLYAIYKMSESTTGSGDYVLVTSTPTDWSGQYLIAYPSSSAKAYVLNGSLTTLDATNNYQSVDVSSNTISATDNDKYSFTIAPSSTSGSYTIKSASGYYIGASSNTNTLTSSTTTTYDNTLTVASNYVDIISSSAHLRYNNGTGQNRFRYFKSSSYSSQQNIQIYKKDGAGTAYTYYTYPSDAALTTPTITFASDKQSMLVGDAAATYPATVEGSTGAVTYTSSDTKVATVDATTGAVTPLAVGTTTITATVAAVQNVSRSASTTYTLTVSMPALESIAVTTQPTTTGYKEGESFSTDGMVVTATYANGYTQDVTGYTVSPDGALATTDNTITISYTEGDVTKTTTVTITVTEQPKYTVTFDAGTGSCATASLKEETAGAGVTLPTATTTAEGWTFAGWATASVEETTTTPTLYAVGDTYKPTADVTLYAVYCNSKSSGTVYQYTTTFTADKTYLYVSANKEGSAYAIDAAKLSTTATKTPAGTAVTITNVNDTPTITTAVSTAEWTASGSTTSMQLQNGNYYMAINGSGMALNTSSKNVYWSSNYGLYGKSSSGSSYYVKPSGSNFSTSSKSGSSTSRVYMFQKVEGQTTTYNSNPAVAEKTLTAIAVTTEPTTVSYTEGENLNLAGLVVTGTYSDGTTAEVTGYTTEPADDTALTTVGSTTVTITYNGLTTSFVVTVAAKPTYTVTFSVMGVESTAKEETSQGGVTPPSVEDVAPYTFCGWAPEKHEPEDTNTPAYVTLTDGKYFPTEDIKLYAVYKRIASSGSGESKTYVLEPTTEGVMTTYNGGTAYTVTVDGVNFTFKNVSNNNNNNYLQFRATNNYSYIYSDDLGANIRQVVLHYQQFAVEGYRATVSLKDDAFAVDGNYPDGTVMTGSEEDLYVTYDVTGSYNHFAIYNENIGALRLFDITIYCGPGSTTYYTTMPQFITIPISENCVCDKDNLHYGTYSNASAFIVPEDVTVAVVGIDADGLLVVNPYKTGDIVAANTGVMVSAKEAGEYKAVVTTDEATALPGDNLLYPSGTDGVTADDMTTAAPGCVYYRLTMHNDTQIGYWWGAEDGAAFSLAANKAYLAVPKSAGASIGMWIGDAATGISDVYADEDGDMYNVAGQRITKPVRGQVYIKNGQKFLAK